MTFNQVVRGSSPRWLTKLEDCITMQSFFILLCSKFLMQKSKISTQTAKKTAEKVENPMIYHLQFTNSNTIYARNRTIYAKGVFVH